MLNLVLFAVVAVTLHSATPRPRFRSTVVIAGTTRTAPPRHHSVTLGPWPDGILAALRHEPDDRPPARPIRRPFAGSDPLAKHRAVTGINAHVRWYQRIGSLIGIAILVVVMGVLLAGLVGVAFFGARIGLELMVG